MQQQQREFSIFAGDKTNGSQLFLDEYFLREKEKYFEFVYHERDHEKALKLLDEPPEYKDEEL